MDPGLPMHPHLSGGQVYPEPVEWKDELILHSCRWGKRVCTTDLRFSALCESQSHRHIGFPCVGYPGET